MDRNKLILGMVSLGHCANHWYNSAFFIILPLLAKDMGLTFTKAGLISTLMTLVGASVNLPSGFIADMVGRKGLQMALAILAPATGYFLVGLSPIYSLMLLSVMLVGFGGALWHPPSMSILSERFSDRRGMALSFHEFGANLGDFLAPLATGALLAVLLWRQVLNLYFFPGILLAILLWFIIPHGRGTYGNNMALREYGRALQGLTRNPRLIQIAGVSTLRTMGQQVIAIFLPFYLAYELKMSPALMGVYVSMLAVSALFAGPVMGTISDRVGRRMVMLWGLGAAGVLTTLLAVFKMGYPFLGTLIMLGLFLFSMRPVIFAYALDITPPEVGATTVALVFGANMLFSSLTPLITGLIADNLGLIYAFYFAGAMILMSGVLAFFLPKGVGKKPAAAPI